jgi:hypothetical protein
VIRLGEAERLGEDDRRGDDALCFGDDDWRGGDALRLGDDDRRGGEALRVGDDDRRGGDALRVGDDDRRGGAALCLGADDCRGGADARFGAERGGAARGAEDGFDCVVLPRDWGSGAAAPTPSSTRSVSAPARLVTIRTRRIDRRHHPPISVIMGCSPGCRPGASRSPGDPTLDPGPDTAFHRNPKGSLPGSSPRRIVLAAGLGSAEHYRCHDRCIEF